MFGLGVSSSGGEFVRLQEQPRLLEFFQDEEHVGGERVLFLHQFFGHVVGGLSAGPQFFQYVVLELRGRVVRSSEFQSEFVRVGKGDALLRFRKGDAGAEIERMRLGKFLLHIAVDHAEEDALEIL